MLNTDELRYKNRDELINIVSLAQEKLGLQESEIVKQKGKIAAQNNRARRKSSNSK